jgi:DNA-directed RNA polymerase subunit E'/Rpb7
LTEEQQGGTAPDTDATTAVNTQATDEPAAAVAVAEAPAQAEEAPAEAPATEASTPEESTPEADSTAEAPSDAELAASQTDGATADAATADAATTEAAADAVTAGSEPAATDTSDTPDAAATADADAPQAAEADAPQAAEAEASDPTDADEAPPEPATPPKPLGPEPTTMEELLAEQDSDIKSFKHGDVVEGTVVRIDKDEMLVDIGAKSEGVVSNRELFGRHGEGQAELNIGDTVLVYVLQPESPEGHVVLSLRRAGLERKWRSMQEQFEAGVIIEAPVIDHNKGGLIVDCGIRGFVPISQIVDFPRRQQNDQPRDAAQEIAEKLMPFVGRKLRLKILEVNRKANRLILSEKVALYEERREKRDELFSSLQVGQKVTGTVRSIAPFGVFIDLGGIDGLVH